MRLKELWDRHFVARVTAGGFEQMFADGGVPTSESSEPPVHEYDPDAARALAESYGFDVVGPQLA